MSPFVSALDTWAWDQQLLGFWNLDDLNHGNDDKVGVEALEKVVGVEDAHIDIWSRSLHHA